MNTLTQDQTNNLRRAIAVLASRNDLSEAEYHRLGYLCGIRDAIRGDQSEIDDAIEAARVSYASEAPAEELTPTRQELLEMFRQTYEEQESQNGNLIIFPG